ncbi:MAG: hypothetical protein RXR08_07450 [Sulfolobaceae archaeon]|jgi:hypothetical protein
MKGAIVAIVILLILAGAAYYLYSNGYFYTVNVQGIYVEYQNSFLINTIHTSYSNSSLTLHGGQTFVITLTMANNGLLPTEITGINVSAPFTLLSVSPSLPTTIDHGQSMSFTLTIKAPMKSYTGSLQIYVNGTKTL